MDVVIISTPIYDVTEHSVWRDITDNSPETLRGFRIQRVAVLVRHQGQWPCICFWDLLGKQLPSGCPVNVEQASFSNKTPRSGQFIIAALRKYHPWKPWSEPPPLVFRKCSSELRGQARPMMIPGMCIFSIFNELAPRAVQTSSSDVLGHSGTSRGRWYLNRAQRQTRRRKNASSGQHLTV